LLKLTDLKISRLSLLSSFLISINASLYASFGGERTSSMTSIVPTIVLLLFSWLPMIVEFYSDSFSGKIRPVDLMVCVEFRI